MHSSDITVANMIQCKPDIAFDVKISLGTSIISVIAGIVLGIICTSYITYQSCFNSKTTIGESLKIVMLFYNYSFLSYLCLAFAIYGHWILTGDATNGATDGVCYLRSVSYIAPALYIFANAYFWFLRLKIVFDKSIFEISQRFEYFLTFTMFVTFFIVSLLFLILIIVISISNNVQFCYYNVYVTDFTPDLTFRHNWFGTSRMNPLQFCEYKVNSTIESIVLLYISIPSMVFPVVTVIVAVSYITRIYRVIQVNINMQQLELEMNKENYNTATERKIDWRNGNEFRKSSIIALMSIGSTWLGILLWVLTANMLFMVLDGLLNSILMFSIFQFGEWIYRYITCNEWLCRWCYDCNCKKRGVSISSTNKSKTVDELNLDTEARGVRSASDTRENAANID